MLIGDLMKKFQKYSTWTGIFFLRDFENIIGISDSICDIPYISFYEGFMFCKAPANLNTFSYHKIVNERRTNYEEDPELFKKNRDEIIKGILMEVYHNFICQYQSKRDKEFFEKFKKLPRRVDGLEGL